MPACSQLAFSAASFIEDIAPWNIVYTVHNKYDLSVSSSDLAEFWMEAEKIAFWNMANIGLGNF